MNEKDFPTIRPRCFGNYGVLSSRESCDKNTCGVKEMCVEATVRADEPHWNNWMTYQCSACGDEVRQYKQPEKCPNPKCPTNKPKTTCFAPLVPDGKNVLPWVISNPKDNNSNAIIRGTWAEDGNCYYVACPHQLAETVVALQKELLPIWMGLQNEAGKRGVVIALTNLQAAYILCPDNLRDIRIWQSIQQKVRQRIDHGFKPESGSLEEEHEREIFARFMAYREAGKDCDEAIALTAKCYSALPSTVEAIVGYYVMNSK